MPPSQLRAQVIRRGAPDIRVFMAFAGPNRLRAPICEAMHWPWLARQLPRWDLRSGDRRAADAAPRGHAKSTLETFFRPLHDIVYGKEAFIVIFSATETQAIDFTRDLHNELSEPTSDVSKWFGPFIVSGGPSDFVVKAPLGPAFGSRVLARSVGQQIRGAKHAGWRVSKGILDDIEKLESVRTPSQRQKLAEYVERDILQSGERIGSRYTAIRAVGTILHPDSWLANAIKNPAWNGKKYKAIPKWPSHPERWEALRQLWADIDVPEESRLNLLNLEYRGRQAWYDEGGEVLWSEANNLLDLHTILWSDGEWAFNAEMQNDPKTTLFGIFDVAGFKRCKVDNERITWADGKRAPHAEFEWAGWLDPIPPDGSGDYASIAVLARHRTTGRRAAVDCELFRGAPSEQVDRIWLASDRWPHLQRFGFEDNGFQRVVADYFERSREARRKADKSADLRLIGETSTDNKESRIASLQPSLWHGHMQIADSISRDVIGQFRDFPGGSHDDAIDAIERADHLIGHRVISTSAPAWVHRDRLDSSGSNRDG